jgi:ubiquinone biosynthesis UbiH/UbiF/VisC/COQ6 family hydroxylase
VHVSDKGHFGGIRLDAEKYDLDALGYVVENKQLGRVLINQLQQRVTSKAINCFAPSTVVNCTPKQSGYELLVDTSSSENKSQNESMQQHRINADLVLVADGADSSLRASLGLGTNSIDYKQTAFIANISLDKYHNDIAYERFTDEGPIALLPLPTLGGVHRAALVWTLPQEKAKEMKNEKPENIVEQLQQRFGFRMGKITSIGERQYTPLTLITAQEQVRSHLAIVGNAAHLLHPVAGQGLNLALRDCWVLSECLRVAERKQIPFGQYSNLKIYLSEQSMDQELTIGLTDGLVKLFSSSRLPKGVLRQLGLFSLNALPLAKKQFAQKMMGLSKSL